MADFVYLFRSTIADRQEAHADPAAVEGSIKKWLAWVVELEAKGHVKDRGQPFDHGGCVVTGGARAISQGPFIDGNSVSLGYLVVQARDMDEAIALTVGCSIVDAGGSVEIRPVLDLGF
jgi:hypothetical protein